MGGIDGVHVPVAGGAVYCEIAGSGPAVILTHDGLVHREGWDDLFTDLAGDHRVARWDRRGYGRSVEADTPYSSADDLASVARSVSAAPVTLVGSSFGALVSLVCTLDNPDLVAALVLVGPIVSGCNFSEHFLNRGGRDLPTGDGTVEHQITYWTQTDPWFIAPGSIAARQRVSTLLSANPHNLQSKMSLEQVLARPAAGRLGDVRVPTLIIVGEGDIPDVHAHAGVIEAGIPGGRRVVLSGCGHSPPIEVPHAFNATVRQFLAALPT
jgi:3-oxoadipate enol-lactonase